MNHNFTLKATCMLVFEDEITQTLIGNNAQTVRGAMGCDTLKLEKQLFLQQKQCNLLGDNPQDIGGEIERIGLDSSAKN